MVKDDRVSVNENEGQVDISLSLDQPSCFPINITARPQVLSIPDGAATGKLHMFKVCISKTGLFDLVNDFDNSTVMVIVDPGDTTATVPIRIFNDDFLEATEVFNVAIGADTNGVIVRQPGVVQVLIIDEDGMLFVSLNYNV